MTLFSINDGEMPIAIVAASDSSQTGCALIARDYEKKAPVYSEQGFQHDYNFYGGAKRQLREVGYIIFSQVGVYAMLLHRRLLLYSTTVPIGGAVIFFFLDAAL